jgi:putative membrane protein
MNLILRLLINTIAVFIGAYIIQGVQVDTAFTAFIVAIVLGVLNAFIKPILMILTLPINILSLGFFTLVINTFIVVLVNLLVPGFIVGNVISAFLFSIAVSLISTFLSSLVD